MIFSEHNDWNLNQKHFSASSWSEAYPAFLARLNGPSSWCVEENVENHWLQIDLGREETLVSIATQSSPDAGHSVNSYTLQYSTDNSRWTKYGVLEVSGLGVLVTFNCIVQRFF